MSCAHAQQDPVTGDYFNFNLSFGYSGSYKVFRTSASTGQTDILATIREPAAKPAYIHSFFLTPNYIVLCIPVSHFSAKGASILWYRNMLDSISPFDATANVLWYVIDRHHGHGVVGRYRSAAMFAFHSVNAYEVPNSTHSDAVDLLCEIIEFPTLDVLHRLYYDNLTSTGSGAHRFSGKAIDRSNITSRLKRYRLSRVGAPSRSPKHQTPHISQGPAVPELEIKSPNIGELPTMNPAYRMRRARYVYTILDRGFSSYVDSLAKTDLDTGDVCIWSTPKHTPGEAIFVARKDAVEEDDGYLLSVVLDGEKGNSYLLCLDARDMSEVARAEADAPIAIGFHGHHLPESKL
jgi:torulene dioxygenase